MSEWLPIDGAPRDTPLWAWGRGTLYFSRPGGIAWFHSDYNGHKDVITANRCGAAFRLGGEGAPTHYQMPPEPPE